MLLLEPLWLCWFGAVVLFTWWTYQQRPAWVQPAWWRRPMGSDWRNHQLFQPAGTPQQGSLAVVHALLLLSRVGEWVQLVCWIGIGWPRAASPAQGYKGPELGSWPSSWLLPGGQRSARSAAQCWEGSGWACSAALLSGTATSPWEVQGTCNIWWELGRKEQCCIYAPQLPRFFFFFTCDWDFVFCVLYDFPVITHAPWLSLQQCLFLARRANLKASSWALYCVSSSDDVCGFHLIMPIFK